MFKVTWRAYFFLEDFALHEYFFKMYFSRALPPPRPNNVSNGPSHLSPLFVFYVHVMTVCKGRQWWVKFKKETDIEPPFTIGIHKTTIVPDYELLGEAKYFPRLTGHIS